jgi:hypothetical protein
MMISLTVKDIGRRVIYTFPGKEVIEEGVVTRFNKDYVFVKYNDNEWEIKATSRCDLKWGAMTSV